MPVFMTRVGIAASPAFRAGFLICAEKGFMVLSYRMRQQRAGDRRAVGWDSYLLWVALDRFLMLKPTVVRFWRAETTKLVGPSSSSRMIAAIAWRLRL